MSDMSHAAKIKEIGMITSLQALPCRNQTSSSSRMAQKQVELGSLTILHKPRADRTRQRAYRMIDDPSQ